MYQRIIVPLDGSELAETALSEAQEMTRLTGAPIRLLRVIDPVQTQWYGTVAAAMDYAAVQAVIDSEKIEATTYLQAVAKRMSDAGIAVQTEMRQGQVTRAIVEAAQPGDMIVMASHGRSGISRWLLGSVAEDVLRHASVPVLLVRAAEPTDAAKTETTA